MTTRFMALVIGFVALAGGDRANAGTKAETPRATQLLRAESLAKRAQDRLRVPRRRGPGWKRGGSGWNDERESAHEDRSVTINVRPAKRRAADD